MIRPKIVILGAGFGGVYVAKKLARLTRKGMIDLTIVNRTNYFLFTPLLHEVATGGLSPGSVAEPLREVFAGRDVKIAQGTVQSINPEKRTVSISCREIKAEIPYDYLVVATGAETNYYGITGAEIFSFPLKNLYDAARIRSRVIDAFEHALLAKDHVERRDILSFVVVGGGATGVEVAAELAEFTEGMIKRYYLRTDCAREEAGHCRSEEVTISLIHGGTELLEMFAPSLRRSAARRLEANGVALKLGRVVSSVTKDSVALSDGSSIKASTVIWTAGVKPGIPVFDGRSPALDRGRLVVDEYFRLKGEERIFALGDAAMYVDADNKSADGKNRPVPMLAQAAVSQSKVVAQNLIATLRGKDLKSFHYHSKGSMVSVGQWFAIGEIYSMNIAGRITWWLWRTVYLFKFASWQKRIRIAFEWTLELFYPRDITKLT